MESAGSVYHIWNNMDTRNGGESHGTDINILDRLGLAWLFRVVLDPS